MQSLLLTGFGPFESVADNPSEILARSSGRPYEIIPVSYTAAKEFVDSLSKRSFDRLLLMGAHGTSTKMHIEMKARNRMDARADASGYIPIQGPIDRDLPDSFDGTLWKPLDLQPVLAGELAAISHDAGGYLCNYIYFEALNRFPHKEIGFLHVPLQERMPIELQKAVLNQLLSTLES